MIFFRKISVFFCICLLINSVSADVKLKYELCANLIERKSPNWKIIEKKDNEVHFGFYNTEPKGELFVFVGPKNVSFNYKNKIWNKSNLAKEAIYIWIMPGDYKPGLMSYIGMKAPVLPEKIFSSNDMVIYGEVSHYIVDTITFKKLLKGSLETGWDEGINVSWNEWEKDVASVLENVNCLKK